MDADEAPGPNINVGDPVTWTYVVTNQGNVDLTNVTVADDQGVVVTCPKAILLVDESMTCTGNGIATAGQYANLGTATGTAPTGRVVEDSDPSHYTNVPTGIDEEEPDAENGSKIFIPFVAFRYRCQSDRYRSRGWQQPDFSIISAYQQSIPVYRPSLRSC